MFFIGKTDVGKRRANNQDCFNITELDGGAVLFTVCDGMGGANGGNIASDIASRVYVSNVRHEIGTDTDENIMKNAVVLANSAVYEAANSDETLKGMGTTLVSALVHENGQITIINVGDSRLYLIKDGDITQITRDHSYVQYLVDMGQITITEAKKASIRNIIIRSIGNEEQTSPDVFNIEYSDNTYLLLCTDGLSNFVTNDQLLKAVKNVSTKEDADKCTDKLIKLANDMGGTDNITVILIKL